VVQTAEFRSLTVRMVLSKEVPGLSQQVHFAFWITQWTDAETHQLVAA
jgi:hypothetical protein